jgi:arylsulfatase A-like enzyme/TolA-binding protein
MAKTFKKPLFLLITTLILLSFSLSAEEITNHFQKGVLLEEKGLYQEAIKEYKAFIVLNKGTAQALEAQFRVGNCYEKKGSFGQALFTYKKLVNKFPQEKEALLLEAVAGVYEKMGREILSSQTYEKVIVLYKKLKDYPKAVEISKKLLKKFPQRKEASSWQLLIGEFLYRAQKYEQAIKELNELLANYPKSEEVPQGKLLLGLCNLMKGENKLAQGLFQKLIKDYPRHKLLSQAQFLLAYSYMQEEKYSQAQKEYQEIIDKCSRSPYLKEARRLVERIEKKKRERRRIAFLQKDNPNIVLISIDTLRADHLSCYGYSKKTSPHIDKLAEEGTLFSQNISAAPWTTPSHMSIFTSLYPILHEVNEMRKRLDEKRVTLAEVLKKNGYTTAAFISAPTMLPYELGFGQGFDLYDDYTVTFDIHFNLFRKNERKLTNNDHPINPLTHWMVTNWLERNHKKSFFIFLHYWDPHYEYEPPPPYNRMFNPDYKGEITGNVEGVKLGMDEEDFNHIVSLYDGEIRYTDEYVGLFLQKLKELNLLDKTLIILTSDHGEEFLEHGGSMHGKTLYDELIHVPLIIRYPSLIPKGEVISAQVRTVDIMPTILALLGISIKEKIDGLSLLPLIQKEKRNKREAFSETYPCLKSLRTEELKFINNLKKEEKEFYDLSKDPKEKTNLIGEREEAKIFDQNLANWMNSQEELLASLPKSRPTSKIEIDPEVRERLRAMGYLQ